MKHKLTAVEVKEKMKQARVEAFEAIERIRRDIREAANTLSPREVSFLVAQYHRIQDQRIRTAHQLRTLIKTGQPHAIIAWFMVQAETIERQVKAVLEPYAGGHHMGRWALSIKGVGPVIAAGLLAELSLNPWRCAVDVGVKACREDEPHGPECKRFEIPTVGHIWAFAGLDPTKRWEKGQRRPWNADLKRLCAFIVGESFVKLQNDPDCFFGGLFKERKAEEWRKNLAGDYADLATKERERFKDDKNAALWTGGLIDPKWAEKMLTTGTPWPIQIPKVARLDVPGIGGTTQKRFPMLRPQNIHDRARRWAVKMFLAAWFEEAYRERYKKEPPLPYPVAHLKHTHRWPFDRAVVQQPKRVSA